MSNDIFVEIDGIAGESQDAMHFGSIEATSWNWSIHQDARYLSGSGGGASKATVSDLTFNHLIDRASPNLAVYCYYGKHISKVTLTARKAGGTPFEYLKITLTDVVITNVNPAMGGNMALETVSLSFSLMRQEYFPQSAVGQSMGAVTGTIDLRQFRNGASR